MGENSEEVKQRWDKVKNKKLTPPGDTFKMNVRLLCLLTFFVISWVFVLKSFLQNIENGTFFMTLPCIHSYLFMWIYH